MAHSSFLVVFLLVYNILLIIGLELLGINLPWYLLFPLAMVSGAVAFVSFVFIVGAIVQRRDAKRRTVDDQD